MYIWVVQRGSLDIMFPPTHRSHSHCPCWGTQTPGPHPGAGCAWEPPPAGPTGRPGSDQLHTMRSQSKSPSGTKPSHRVMGQITGTSSTVHTMENNLCPDFISLLYLYHYYRNISVMSQSNPDFLLFINEKAIAAWLALISGNCVL